MQGIFLLHSQGMSKIKKLKLKIKKKKVWFLFSILYNKK